MESSVSDDVVGLIAMGLTIFLLLVGWRLAEKGLSEMKKTAAETDEAAKKVKKMAGEMKDLMNSENADAAAAVADTAEEMRDSANSLDRTAGDLSSALKELKGPLAPARTFMAFAALTFIVSIIAFGIVSLTVDTGDDTTTTTTTP